VELDNEKTKRHLNQLLKEDRDSFYLVFGFLSVCMKNKDEIELVFEEVETK
jgi:hypothetical protein